MLFFPLPERFLSLVRKSPGHLLRIYESPGYAFLKSFAPHIRSCYAQTLHFDSLSALSQEGVIVAIGADLTQETSHDRRSLAAKDGSMAQRYPGSKGFCFVSNKVVLESDRGKNSATCNHDRGQGSLGTPELKARNGLRGASRGIARWGLDALHIVAGTTLGLRRP